MTSLFSLRTLIELKFSSKVFQNRSSFLSVKEYYEFISTLSHLISLAPMLYTKQGKNLKVFRTYRFHFSFGLKLKNLQTILSLLNDTKQYVYQIPTVTCFDGRFEHSTARQKVDNILFVGVFVHRAEWLTPTYCGITSSPQ